MRKFTIFLLASLLSSASFSQQNYWSARANTTGLTADKSVARLSFPKVFKVFDLNIQPLRQQLFSVTDNQGLSTIISLPNVDGNFEQFEVFEASNFEPALQASFPSIRAFSGRGITDKYATLKLSISPQGIQTMVFRADKENEFIEAYSSDHTVYAVFRSYREPGTLNWTCSTEDKKIFSDISSNLPNSIESNAGQLKTMRLAQSCNGEYANWFGATSAAQVSLVLAAYNATLTRCNGCYEKDLAIHLNLIANTTAVIYYNPATDPYTSMGQWNSQLQATLTANIGEANYDIGHMFGASGGGGNAGCIGCVCVDGSKGSGITSPADGIPQGDNFDIDYVVHEVGHQMGGNHTFSHSLEGSGVNKEVGGGITIMGYAGITNYDPAPHSIAIFHQATIAQIQANMATKTCPVNLVMTANHVPVVAALSNFTIPISTPFALTGSATDPEGDPLTYCWEQNNNATTSGANSVASPTKATGPNWLSFMPSTSPTRTLPILSTILAGLLVTPPLPGGDAVCNIEALSSVSRTLAFRLTVRDNRPYVPGSTIGLTEFKDMTVTVSNTSGPFDVTSPNTNVSWAGSSTQTITWNVANTTLAPVSCANVKISLSTDGGTTFPTVLLASTPNDGTQTVTIPNTPSTTARIKVEAVGNIFFDISNTNFTITASSAGFTLNAPNPSSAACPAPSTMQTTVTATYTGGYTNNITLSASGNPAGTTVVFGTNPLTTVNTSSTVTLTGTNTLLNGSYIITVTGTSSPATPQNQNITFTINPGTAPNITLQPATQTVCQGSNVSFSVTATGSLLTYQWYYNSGSGYNPIAGATSPSYPLNNVQPSNNGLYRCVVTGQCGNVTSSEATLTVNAPPVVNAPTITQTGCPTPATGTIVVNATGSGTLEYSLNGGTYQVSSTFSGLAPGNYNITVRLQSTPTCITSYSANPVVINPVPSAPTVNAPTVTQPTCAVPGGTIVVNASGGGTLEYSINGGGAYQLSNTFSSLAPGNYNIFVRVQANPSCVTTYSSNPVVINAIPSAPTVNAPTVTQPNCSVSTGTIVVNATGGGTLEYSINGGGSWQISNTFTGLASGNYNISVRLVSSITCVTSYSGNPVMINVAPSTPIVNAPTVTQPTCATPSGTIAVNASGGGTLEYSLNGGTFQLSNTFSALASGNYNIAVRLQSTPTCITNYSGNPVVINTAPVNPDVDPVSNQTLNNGSMTTAVNFTGSVPGTVYNWTNDNTSIGLAASGTGNIASFMAINNTASVVTATVTVTPSYTNAGGTCIGAPTSFTYTVNPTPSFIRGSVKKDADPTKTDLVFKATFTNNPAEYINYLQLAVAIPLANAAGVTATATGVNNFQDMGSLVPIAPYTEGTERIFGFIYFNPNPPSPVNNFNWTNGTEFTGIEVSFSNSTAASIVRMVDFTNNGGGTNANTYFAIVSNSHGDLTDYFTNLFFAIPTQSQLGNYPNGDQYVETIGFVPPINDDAPGSILLTVGAGCTGSPYTNANSSQSSGEPFAACKGTTGYRTVWYKFIAPASGAVRITNDFGGGTMGSDSRIALFSTTDVNNYATFSSIACDDDNGAVIADRSILYATGLTAGNTYYIQVDGKVEFTTTGTFCLAVDELASSMLTTSTGCVANQSLSLVNNNYTGWLSLCDGTGNLVALIKNPVGSVSTSSYSSSQNINAAAVRQDAVTGQYYLNRNFNINNPDVSNINIRFFFLNTELSALQGVDPVVTLNNLQITRQTGSSCQNDFVAANGTNSSIVQTSNTSGTGYSTLLITTPGLSNFYLHTGKSFVPVKTYLQGAYNAGQSRHKDVTSTWAAVMNANALNQPYNVTPYSYTGTESVSPGFFVSTGAITDGMDWVLLELRNAITPSILITRRAALIREDGRIVDLNGTSDVSFRNLTPGNYFLVVRHRNHLDIRSSALQVTDGALGFSSSIYDFSNLQSKAYQDPANFINPAQKDFGNGAFGMFGGNGNSNTTVRASGPVAQNDYLFLINTTLGGDVTAVQSNVYKTADTNMDGAVRASGPLAQNDYLFLITTLLGGDVTKIIAQHQ